MLLHRISAISRVAPELPEGVGAIVFKFKFKFKLPFRSLGEREVLSPSHTLCASLDSSEEGEEKGEGERR